MVRYDDDMLTSIFEKTDGYCRYCGKKLAWSNYGRSGERGAWVVDHSVPQSGGGTDYFRNLWPSCVDCNLRKGTLTGPEFLRRQGVETQSEPTFGGILVGAALVGIALAIIGSLVDSTRSGY